MLAVFSLEMLGEMPSLHCNDQVCLAFLRRSACEVLVMGKVPVGLLFDDDPTDDYVSARGLLVCEQRFKHPHEFPLLA